MTLATQILEELDDCFVKTAANIMKYYDNEKAREKILGELRDTVKENCAELAKMEAANEIKGAFELTSEENLNRNIQEIINEYHKAISEIQVNLSKDNRLSNYDRQILRLLEVNNVTSTQPDDLDTDLQLTGKDINVIDPISKTRMTDPVKNAVCGHVYDRESLVAMLQKNNKTRCPVVGCNNMDYINLSQCHTDIVTKMYLEKNPE